MSKINEAFALFDAYNKQDPRTLVWDGVTYPQEYFYAHKLYEWVLKINPQANDTLLLASRCQHIGRWEIPREDYPEGREGYLKWRKNLGLHHAEIAAGLLHRVGYSDEQIERVKQIVLKQRIKVDPDVQTMENALCLVFLAYQFEDFRTKHLDYQPEKMINILRKSLLKMDAYGHQFTLELPYSPEALFLVNEAVNSITKKQG